MDESRSDGPPGPKSDEAGGQSSSTPGTEAAAESEAAEAAPPSEPVPGAAAKASSVAARIKVWADATTALLKALLMIAAIVVVAVVIASVIRHDDSKRQISLQVEPDTEKTLSALGSDLDLRQVFADALNERLRGVKKIVQVQGLDKVIGLGQAETISLKPLGLDMSTSEIARLLREIKGSPAPLVVRMGLLCTPRPCTDPGASEGILVVGFSGLHGTSRASYSVPLTNPAFRRSLRQAMQRAADRLLDVEEPLVASIFYLNRQDVLLDERLDNLARAESAALRSRDTSRESCTTDLVVGASLIARGRWNDGIEAEKRAARSSDPTCQVHGWTNIVFLLQPYQLCNPSRDVRDFAYEQMRQAVAALPSIDRGNVSDLVYNRIPTSRLALEIADALRQTDDEAVRQSLCEGNATVSPPVRTSLAETLPGILKHIQELLPASGRLQSEEHVLLELYRRLLVASVPREDGGRHLAIGVDLAKAIDAYLLTDRHPRLLFLIQGNLAMDMARAAHTAVTMRSAEKSAASQLMGGASEPAVMFQQTIADNLGAAQVAFANAVANESEGELLEPSPNIQPLTWSGDALLLAGDIQGATRAYMRAVDAFIDDDEDASELIPFAEAVGRWAILSKARGACKSGAVPDVSWEERWAHLGGGAHDVCAFDRPDRLTNIPALIGPIVADLLDRCLRKVDGTSDWQADQDRRFALVDCLNDRSEPVRGIREPLLQSAATNSAIERALSQRRAATP